MIKVGEHITLDIIGTTKEYDPSVYERVIHKIAKAANVTILNISKYKFEPQGFTILALLAESHISFHTFPEKGIISFDFFTCGKISPTVAINIIKNEFEHFSHKHYVKLQERLGVNKNELKVALNLISRLNPKPGGSLSGSNQNTQVVPDFILTIENGELIVMLNHRNAPQLRVSNEYKEMLLGYSETNFKSKPQEEAVQFIKQKLDSAKWFIDAIKQRHQTLELTINAILDHQTEYFLTGDERKLRPMILKDIAEKIEMDISTISRVASSKYIDTPYGVKLLKNFFSEGLKNQEGEDVSSIEIKKNLEQFISLENKKKPLTDQSLSTMMKEKGYIVARRTIAKYREQLDIPVARMRKEL